MALVVQKYGGSSLANPRHIRRAADRIKTMKAQGLDVLVVVSAMGRMTDHLIRLANRTVRRPPQREMDMLMTAGERVSMALLAMALDEIGVSAISFTGSQSGIVTSSDHTDARIVDIRAIRIREALSRGKVVIVAGFQGVSLEKEITTLGRGGSDTTAIAMAAALGAQYCEILTDVDGIFTADPRLVPEARLLAECDYDHALELASLGAKMHPRSLALARRYRVNVIIRSSSNFDCLGTAISTKLGDVMEGLQIKGIATREGYSHFQAVLSLDSFFSRTREKKIALRFFSFENGRVSFLCDRDQSPLVRDALNDLAVSFEEVTDVSIVSLVGDGLLSSADLIPESVHCISDAGSSCLFLAANSLSVTAAIPTAHRAAVAQRLHQHWFGDTQKKRPPPEEGAHIAGGETLPIR